MSDDPVLVRIAEEAQRLMRGTCSFRVQGQVDASLVIELSGVEVQGIEQPGGSILKSRWLHKRLTEFCEREQLPRRYLILSGSTPKFTSKPAPLPDAWPVDPPAPP